MMGFAILGIYWASSSLPSGQSFADAAQVIHSFDPNLTDQNWQMRVDQIAHHPTEASPELVGQLKTILGPTWQNSLPMISSRGTVNPEVILPAVVLHQMPSGLRGLLAVALLSALMGALTSQVNFASALFVRDIYQKFLRPSANNRELIYMAYLASAAFIILSFIMGISASSINEIWAWFIMSLTAGALGPGILRLYWWRTNAWGMAGGLLAGAIAAIAQRETIPNMPEWLQFLVMTGISIAFTIIVSLFTSETPREVVSHFYQTTRPFGIWGPFWKNLPLEQRRHWKREHVNDICATGCALLWQILLFLIPMQILTHNLKGQLVTWPLFLLCCLGLYFFWWRNLPSPDEKINDFDSCTSIHSEPKLNALGQIHIQMVKPDEEERESDKSGEI
jgi:hypothetical protein